MTLRKMLKNVRVPYFTLDLVPQQYSTVHRDVFIPFNSSIVDNTLRMKSIQCFKLKISAWQVVKILEFQKTKHYRPDWNKLLICVLYSKYQDNHAQFRSSYPLL